MHCCLCIKPMDIMDEHKLYTADGSPSAVYNITCKYFSPQLRFLETYELEELAKGVCSSCWNCLRDFNDFEQQVSLAHQQFTAQHQNTAFIKVEMEMPVQIPEDATNVMECDPVKIESQPDVLQVNGNDHEECQSEDDKPLASRRDLRKRKSSQIDVKKMSKKRLKKTKEAKKPKIKTSPTSDCSAPKRQEQDEFIASQWGQHMKCGECSALCDNFADVRSHFRQVHNKARSYVVCCERKYFHRFHLVDHLQLHINPEYFKCNECGKCLGNRRSLKTHMKEGHNDAPLEKRYECPVCQKRFAKAGILKGHMDIHAEGSKDFVCNVCGKGFVLKNRLAIHLRTVHDNTGGGVCDQCGKAFKDRYSLKRHLLEHAGIMAQKWPCDLCSAQLHSKYSLRRHKRVAHHDGTTVYKCSECGKVALTSDALRSHKQYMHEKKRIYKCNICDKAFKVAVVLKEHMTTHTGEDLYKCPHCPKTFKVCANMHHHRKRVHPKEWLETHQIRKLAAHTDLSSAANEIVM